ncbi:glutamate receptor U1 [Diachasma alloeum]|uniref:Ionotropic receptor 68a n=1 Tax=Diachasma alloeum TaxID=454923 RepID=A0A4E0RZ16_9HYME|nr:glutamate receptor U1 [Diachasma alloeum]THK33101.1 ionotropic receptor 68a [Diachasma alloeum]
MTQKSKCIVFMIDPYYRKLIRYNWAQLRVLPYYSIYVKESEEFTPPRRRVEDILSESKNDGCDAYVLLITNGLQVSQLLEYAERNRIINTRGNFLMIHDTLLFDVGMKYIWNRITKVMFIHRFTVLTRRSNKTTMKEWFNLETVSYPVRANNFVKTRYVNTWHKGRMLNKDVDNPFTNKTLRLERRSLRVAIFEHIPAVTRYSRQLQKHYRDYSEKASGVEFEIMRVLSDKMHFKPNFYTPVDIEIEKWGTKDDNGSYNGLLGEAERGNAEFFLGDLHYTLRHFELLELSYPYNTECLTFLTPESLTDNSWKLLISPFRLYAWIAVILILLLGACAFHFFALFYQNQIMPYVRNTNAEGIQMRGLTLFTDMQNSMLYTYSMLLQVSLPRLPRPWALRVFIGWWLLYAILVTVAYRASMTATLANPVAKITIDTLQQLAKSRISVGGWSEEQRDLFGASLDPDLIEIATRFELTLKEDDAVARVANGTFGYYDNIQTLQEARAKRQLLEEMRKKKSTREEKVIDDRNLHVMSECVIYMPISIGMDRNSPLKPQVDEIVRRVVEAGFVEKWLSDVTEWSKITELKDESPAAKATVNLHKLHGALVALGIGYFLGFLALIIEKIQWKYFVMKDPAFDKYQMDVFYSMSRSNFINKGGIASCRKS